METDAVKVIRELYKILGSKENDSFGKVQESSMIIQKFLESSGEVQSQEDKMSEMTSVIKRVFGDKVLLIENLFWDLIPRIRVDLKSEIRRIYLTCSYQGSTNLYSVDGSHYGEGDTLELALANYLSLKYKTNENYLANSIKNSDNIRVTLNEVKELQDLVDEYRFP